MKLAFNQATLMKTPMEIFLKAISSAGFEGVELRRDETFKYLKSNSITDLKISTFSISFKSQKYVT